ncbi:ABC transporter ATP-binding protein [candidate division FCPU426 bacterium]|nr:ABC transporter ATP-binding protein [candidate division FCPU426 bacterium]
MKLYLRLLTYAKPYIMRIIAAFVCLAVTAGLTALGMYLIKPVLDKVLGNPDHAQALFYLRLVPVAILLTYLFKGFSTYGQDYLINNIGNRIVMDLRNQLYAHLMNQELAFFHNQRSGLLISRVTHDATLMQSAVSNVLGRLLGSLLNIVALVILLFYLDWKLAVVSLFVFPVAVYPIISIGKALRRISRESQAKMADITTVLHESITGIRVVKAFTMQAYEIKRFGAELQQYFNLVMRALRKTAISSPLMEFIGSLGICFMIVWSGTQVINGQSTSGTFFAFLGGLASLYPQVKALAGINNTVQQALAAAQRVFELLDKKPLVQDAPHARHIKTIKSKIEFKNVSFAYQPDKMVLQDIQLTVRAGGVLAIVGRSGAGKTTLVDLIPRFMEVTAGEIMMDDLNIKNIVQNDLRSLIGLVTQETILFNDTIRNNIAYGKPQAALQEIEAAAKAANAHGFIMQTRHGYDTAIGERGVRLSGGQRQRLAIARAILKNPPILILDEATSALDTESERLIQDALEKLMKNRTTFVIAHRLSTVQHADQIVVLDEGRIVERGQHAQLMSKQGLYRRLVKLQFHVIGRKPRAQKK